MKTIPGSILDATPEIEAICERLVRELDASVGRNVADGILLSGGLDTSILAYLSSRRREITAFTVAFEGAPALDVEYAAIMANHLKLKHFVHYFDRDELHDAIQMTVKSLDSFDPMEIRNSAAIYIGLRESKRNGVNAIMTGDGCDELLAGYSFLFSLTNEELRSKLEKMWAGMRFSSVRLAEALGMKAKLPYLDPEFRQYAAELNVSLKVRKEQGQIWGKWILRKAFEKLLPGSIIWRVKTPVELGSGTAILPDLFDMEISDTEFNEKRTRYRENDLVTIRDKEQLFYYEVYRKNMGAPSPTAHEGKTCPYCNLGVAEPTTYCNRCGAYPI
ncbi:MAG: asparagine synthase C-terminal domain-containing protein [Methanobacteriota archaeon]